MQHRKNTRSLRKNSGDCKGDGREKDSLQEELLAYGIQSLKAERERVRNLDQERERLEIERNRIYRQQTEVEQILGRAQEEWKIRSNRQDNWRFCLSR